MDNRQRLGAQLVREGLISEGQLSAALKRQLELHGRLGTNLIELGALQEDTVSLALGRHHGVPSVFRTDFDRIDPAVLGR